MRHPRELDEFPGLHPHLAGDAAGRQIFGPNERDHAVLAEYVKGMIAARNGRFERVPLPPMRMSDEITHFHHGHVADHASCEPDLSHGGGGLQLFHKPQPATVGRVSVDLPADPLGRFLPRIALQGGASFPDATAC